MSDQYYREQAARRGRLLWIIGLALALLACASLSTVNAFRDSCTGSFERQPADVVASYVAAIDEGNGDRLIKCWDHDAYYEIGAGCSEICLSRIMGQPHQLVALEVGEVTINDAGRANLPVAVTIACADGRQYQGELLLDSVAADWPWRHWKIIRSDVGGPLAEPWCAP